MRGAAKPKRPIFRPASFLGIICGTLLPGWFVAALGAVGLQAQEVVDLPAEDLPLRPDLELVYRIGSAGAESEWQHFSSIEHIAFDGAGNLYLMDSSGGFLSVPRIVVVDAAGGLVTEFGRAGDGPGEFRGVSRMAVWPDGRIVVEDLRRLAYHVFGPDGEFERMVRVADGNLGITMRYRLLTDRTGEPTLVGPAERSILRADMSSEEMREDVLLEAWDPRGSVDAGASVETETPVVSDGVWGFEPDVLVDVLPSGGLAFSDSSAYAVKITDPSGVRLRTLRRPVSPRPVTEAMRRAERQRRLEAITVSSSGAPSPDAEAFMQAVVDSRTAAIENMRFFAEIPVISALRATWNGGLWVQRSGEPDPSEPGLIDVLAPDGRYVGSLDPGQPGMPDAFGPDGLVAFVETDDLDVPVITVWRLPAEIR